MTDLASTIDIARPPHDVFEYLTDPARFAEWQYDVRNVRAAWTGTPAVGMRFTTVRRIGGTDRTMTQEVTDCRPPHRWEVAGEAGTIRPRAVITVEPINGGTRSRVTFTLGFAGHGIGVPLLPMVRRIATKGAKVSYARAKQLLEAGAEPMPPTGPDHRRGGDGIEP